MEERRNSDRVKRTLPAWYRQDQGTFNRSVAFAVGANGARLVTECQIERNQAVNVTLKLDGQMVSVAGKAVWNQPADNYSGRFLVGVQFDIQRAGDLRHFHRWHHTQKMKEELADRAC